MKDPRVYLAHILETLEKVEQFTKRGREVFLADELVHFAVVRCFEVIGEAAKRVPEEFRHRHSEIPWRSMAAFRDVLIHQYEGVDLERVWQVVENEAPRVRMAVQKLLPPLEELERELAEETPAEPENHEG